jgi:hypothetical protein
VATLATPPGDEPARVYGPRTPHLVEGVSLIGGLPGEVLEVEVQWTLPRPGRRLVPPRWGRSRLRPDLLAWKGSPATVLAASSE